MTLGPAKHPRRRFGKFIPKALDEPQEAVPPAYSLDLIRSRALLVQVLGALAPHSEALTVVGAHAIVERTRELEPYLVSDATRDADLGVTPGLLIDDPLLTVALRALGLEEAHPSRPGVWGLVDERDRELRDRLTIDLIAPASLAGGGRRAARIGAHGARAVSKTAGTELTVIDRSMMDVSVFDSGKSIQAYVAGSAALLCAKAYKLFDRLDDKELQRNRRRLRTKDAADIYRLMANSDPMQVREVFRAGQEEASIGPAVRTGAEHLLSIREPLIDLARMHYRHMIPAGTIAEAMNEWLDEFDKNR